ncbi:putative F-box domain, WD40-repeat-containing domain superfamily [Septoria linicola]|nr:putative F-box domain, WD40-repeat-containing domain superfamily [Septoria linicola]
MAKRAREESTDVAESASKKLRSSTPDHLSALSDELLLKVLSFLSVSNLVVCQRLSHKYQKLAGDGQLWKQRYYDRFVRPRASRLPGLKELGSAHESLHFSSRTSRWLDDDHLVRHGGRTNWKRQYKLRHNWSSGSCAINEIPIAERQSIPPVLVQMSDGFVFMADKDDGLRAWTVNGRSRDHFAQIALPAARIQSPPTSLAVDLDSIDASTTRVLLGFEDGSFSIYALSLETRQFRLHCTHAPSSNGVITSTAICWPFIVTMTATQLLSLYFLDSSGLIAHSSNSQAKQQEQNGSTRPPRLLHSLKSRTVWPPLSISLRAASPTVTISIAYAMPTYLSGWTVGLQEVKVSTQGVLLGSRLASAIDQHYRPLAFSSRPMLSHLNAGNSGATAGPPSSEWRHIHAKPTSLSYTHPYLLVSHPDNTLTLYLVTSTADSLSISAGSRLWGHTSAVSGAHVAARGKAVSISRRGDELRVWELEGGFATSSARKRLAGGDLSVKIKAGKDVRDPELGSDVVHQDVAHTDDDSSDDVNELTLSRGWVGFNEENVVVLKEHRQGKQALVVYDFT